MKPSALVFMLGVAAVAVAKHDSGDGGADKSSTSGSSTVSATPSASFTPSPSPPPSSSSSVDVDSGTTTAAQSTASSVSSSATASASANVTASGTASASEPAPSSVIKFTPPGNLTTCEQASFTWEYNGTTPRAVTIVVTNDRTVSSGDGGDVDDVDDSDFVQRRGVVAIRALDAGRTSFKALSLGPRQQTEGMAPLVTVPLATSIDARTCVVQWAAVNVSAGAYNLLAFDAGSASEPSDASLTVQSPTFFVATGTDTSCLDTASLGGTPTAAPDSDSDDGTGGGKGSLSAGALGGIIAGVVIAMLALIAAFVLPRVCRRREADGQPRRWWGLRAARTQRPGAPYYLF